MARARRAAGPMGGETLDAVIAVPRLTYDLQNLHTIISYVGQGSGPPRAAERCESATPHAFGKRKKDHIYNVL